MVKGRLDKKASTATGFAWFVWKIKEKQNSKLIWIPPCRSSLEKDDDYELQPTSLKDKMNKNKNSSQHTLL